MRDKVTKKKTREGERGGGSDRDIKRKGGELEIEKVNHLIIQCKNNFSPNK